jgi:hypothetical protein
MYKVRYSVRSWLRSTAFLAYKGVESTSNQSGSLSSTSSYRKTLILFYFSVGPSITNIPNLHPIPHHQNFLLFPSTS